MRFRGVISLAIASRLCFVAIILLLISCQAGPAQSEGKSVVALECQRGVALAVVANAMREPADILFTSRVELKLDNRCELVDQAGRELAQPIRFPLSAKYVAISVTGVVTIEDQFGNRSEIATLFGWKLPMIRGNINASVSPLDVGQAILATPIEFEIVELADGRFAIRPRTAFVQ